MDYIVYKVTKSRTRLSDFYLLFIFIVTIHSLPKPEHDLTEFILSSHWGYTKLNLKEKYWKILQKKTWPVRMAHKNFFNLIQFNVKPASIQTKSVKSYPNSV